MKKIVFYVFSGTGNTLKVANACAAMCGALGAETTVFRLRKGEKAPEVADFDTVVAAFPVHGFNAPRPMLDFLEELSGINGKKFYFLMTSGEPLSLNDAAEARPESIVSAKGGDVRGAARFVMPYNIIFRHSDGMAARMWQTVLERLPKVAEKIANGGSVEFEVGIGKRILSGLFSIEHPAMPLIGRGFYATDDCIGCGRCERECSEKNIVMKDGKPEFGKNCVGCMGCSFGCPTDAVRTGILNGWRVNGAYDFSAVPATEDEFCDFLKKSYVEYFQNDGIVLK